MSVFIFKLDRSVAANDVHALVMNTHQQFISSGATQLQIDLGSFEIDTLLDKKHRQHNHSAPLLKVNSFVIAYLLALKRKNYPVEITNIPASLTSLLELYGLRFIYSSTE